MKKLISFIVICLIVCLIPSCSKVTKDDATLHLQKITNECNGNDQVIKDILPDYKIFGFNGNECVSEASFLAISYKIVDRIEISRNTAYTDNYKVYDVKIVTDKGKDSNILSFTRNNVGNRFSIFIDDYFFGAFTIVGPVEHELNFTVDNKDLGEFSFYLRKLSTNLVIKGQAIGFAGGDVNLYGYVGNNSINYIDPFGLFEMSDETRKKYASPGFTVPEKGKGVRLD